MKLMATWRLKACQRCGGDTFVDKDIDGWFEQCLLCSHRRELKEFTLRPKEPTMAGKAESDITAA